jgi:uncharacterized membrane protein YraQ (UPF0718 family)
MYELLYDGLMIFMGILVEATPFILVGVLMSAVLQRWVGRERLLKIFPKNVFGASLAAVGMGFCFPVCECGNIPVARRLVAEGVPVHAAITFLLAAPTFNPVVILATAAAFKGQPEMVWVRIVVSLFIALGFGLLFSRNARIQDWVQITPKVDAHEHKSSSTGEACCAAPSVSSSMASEFFEMMGWLILGAAVASFLQVLIPRSVLLSLGSGEVLSVVAMMILAILVSICSNVDAFFALNYTSTFSSGALLAFLILGPMLDVKSILMLRTLFKPRFIVLLSVLLVTVVGLIALLINFHMIPFLNLP